MKLFIIQIGNEKARLIEAKSKKAAIAFALPVVVKAEVAKAADVAELMADGCKVEVAEWA